VSFRSTCNGGGPNQAGACIAPRRRGAPASRPLLLGRMLTGAAFERSGTYVAVGPGRLVPQGNLLSCADWRSRPGELQGS